MELYIKPSKRKSLDRLDEETDSRDKVKKDTISELGIGNFRSSLVSKSEEPSLVIDIMDYRDIVSKAGAKHLPLGAERFAYTPTTERGIIYIPTNRLEQVYQTDSATDPSKVKELIQAMIKGTPIDPVLVGYSYDVHDGHHRWEAAMALGHTHVPCKIVGTDPIRVREAKENYRNVWKALDIHDLTKSFDKLIKHDIIDNDEPNKAIKVLDTVTRMLSDGPTLDMVHRVLGAKEVDINLVTGKVSKSLGEATKLSKSFDEFLRAFVIKNLEDEHEAIVSYSNLLQGIEDKRTRDVILEIMYDEMDHYHNLSQVLKLLHGDKKALRKKELKKSLEHTIDLVKAKGKLNKAKLIQVRTRVTNKDGTHFYRLQWVDPSQDMPKDSTPVKDGRSSYKHNPEGIKEMERQQRNKFPIVYHPTGTLVNDEYRYKVDNEAYAEALRKYEEGEPLPVLKITPDGKVIENHHLLDLAKDLGISHIPSIVLGNTTLKKELEDRLKDKVVTDEGEVLGRSHKKPVSELSQSIIDNFEYFNTYVKKAYPHAYIMEQAVDQGIDWNMLKKDGEPLAMNSQMMWMRAHVAIEEHIKSGKTFMMEENKKVVQEHMEDQGKDTIHSTYLALLTSFNGNKQELMDYSEGIGIKWKHQADPHINWMNAMQAIKKHLAKGNMINGFRTRQKQAMEDANVLVTDQIKTIVREYKENYGMIPVADRAKDLGIVWNEYTKKNGKMTLTSKNKNALWLRISQAISRYIAEGNEFTMGDETDQGLAATVGDYGEGVKLTRSQALAMDVGKRNTQRVESESKEWALKSLMLDRDLNMEEAGQLYEKFMENARKSKMVVYMDPLELLEGGVTLIDQIMSDGNLKNDWELNRGYDEDHRGYNENMMFTDDYYDAPVAERPVYGFIDLFNQGDSSFINYGEVGLVLKSSISSRTTGSHIDADNIPYGQDGQTVRAMDDPHHLLVDRWRAKWKNPNKRDAQRQRAMDAIISGSSAMEDLSPFEIHIHGGLSIYDDIDHITVPSSWKNDKAHKEKMDKVVELASLTGTSIKYTER